MADLPRHEIQESIGHHDRGTTTVEAADIVVGDDECSLPLEELVARLSEILSSIPAEHRASACLNVKAYGDYATAYANVTWTRPETDEELADRRRWLKSIQDDRERREKAAYEHLKEKYGDA